MSVIKDPDVRMLASIAETLRGDYVDREQEDLWAHSPFDWIRRTSSRRKGKIGEQLVAGWCAAKGFSVSASGDSEADRVIAGFRAEIKLSTLGKRRVQVPADQGPRVRDSHLPWDHAV